MHVGTKCSAARAMGRKEGRKMGRASQEGKRDEMTRERKGEMDYGASNYTGLDGYSDTA